MSSPLAQLQEATIKQHCKTLRMPMMASQFSTLAEQAIREKKTPHRVFGSSVDGRGRRTGAEYDRPADQRSASAAGENA